MKLFHFAIFLSTLLDVIVAQSNDTCNTVCLDGVTPPPDMAKPLPAIPASFYAYDLSGKGLEPTCGGISELLVDLAVLSRTNVTSCSEMQEMVAMDSGFDFHAYCNCPGTEEFVPVCDPFCDSSETFVGADVVGYTDDGTNFTCGDARTYYEFYSNAAECQEFDEPKMICCGIDVVDIASETDNVVTDAQDNTGGSGGSVIPDADVPDAAATGTSAPAPTTDSGGRIVSLAFATSLMLFNVIFLK